MADTDYSSYSRGMIKYTSRDYESLMKDFWDIVPKLTELWRPDIEAALAQPGTDATLWRPEAAADPGVVLGKVLASAADMLGVNLDWLANEIFAPSVSQRKNAEKLFGLIGYELGWYTAARTEVTFKNSSTTPLTLDFGFNGNFATLNAYSDITNQARVITYNVLPRTNKYGDTETRNRKQIITSALDVFADSDPVALQPGETTTRVAIEGELRSITFSAQYIKDNNYIVKLPSQHIDTTAVWIRVKAKSTDSEFLSTRWVQCTSPADFAEPEPRFAVTYDSYSNAQVQISNYLNQLENYSSSEFTFYWIDCSGIIGCVAENVLSNFLPAVSGKTGVNDFSAESGEITISNLSNTVELPHTHTVTGRSPETAKEAYYNSRYYVTTFDSLVTLPDFNRFLNREPGVDCGLVIDCQKALEINLAIYNDENLTDDQKNKMYITNADFPEGDPTKDWTAVLDMKFDPNHTSKFTSNFKTYTAMCFAVHNDFLSSSWGEGQRYQPNIQRKSIFDAYKPPLQFIDDVVRDYKPLQAMSVELQFGFLRVFNWYVVGQIYTKSPVSVEEGKNIINRVKEALALHFAPANRYIGQKPTIMEVVNLIQSADSRIAYFDAGSLKNTVINWHNCDIEYFNPISFARYKDIGYSETNIRISPDCLIK